jgi:hypothetical protein
VPAAVPSREVDRRFTFGRSSPGGEPFAPIRLNAADARRGSPAYGASSKSRGSEDEMRKSLVIHWWLGITLLMAGTALGQPAKHPFTANYWAALRSARAAAVSVDGTILYHVTFGGEKGLIWSGRLRPTAAKPRSWKFQTTFLLWDSRPTETNSMAHGR